MRSRGGFNNNPTARQFETAFKRLIVHSQVKAGNTGNVKNLDATSILTCSSSCLTTTENGENVESTQENINFELALLQQIREST